MNIIKDKELVGVTAGLHSHGQFQTVLFLLHCLYLWLSQCSPEDSQTWRSHQIHSHLAWSHWLRITHTRLLWLLTRQLWGGSEDPRAHPHQLIFFRSSPSERTLGPPPQSVYGMPPCPHQPLRLLGVVGKWPKGVSHDPTPHYLFLGQDTHFLLLSSENLIGRRILNAAAAKSLQSCPTLCDPIDGSPPGSPIPGILQARTLEWVAISFSNAWKWKVKVKSLSRVWLLVTPWTSPPGSSIHGIFQARVLE